MNKRNKNKKIKLNYEELFDNDIKELSLQSKFKINNIFDFKYLVNLKLVDCGIKYISKQFIELKKLKYLDLRINKIKRINKNISFLTNIKILDLRNNKIKYISPALYKLDKWTNLELRFNKISLWDYSCRYFNYYGGIDYYKTIIRVNINFKKIYYYKYHKYLFLSWVINKNKLN